MDETKRSPSWEILAALVGYIASVEPAINLIGHYFFGYEKDKIPYYFCICVAILYLIIMFFIGAWTLWKSDNNILDKDPDKINIYRNEKAIKIIKKERLLRIFRSIFTIIIYDFVLNIIGVKFHDGFTKTNNWPERNDILKHVDRYYFKDKTIEFQYSKNHSFIESRSISEKDQKFNGPKKLKWRATPHHWLTLGSWTGLFWTLTLLAKTIWLYIQKIINIF
jgi:hypothetical protein